MVEQPQAPADRHPRAPLRFRRTFVNYLLSSLVTFPVGLLTVFVLTPALVRIMGIEAFGLFATYSVVFAVLGLTELGLPTAAMRDTAGLLGRDELAGVYRLGRNYVLRAVRTGLLVTLAGYVGVGAYVLWVRPRTDWLSDRQIGDLLITFSAPVLSMPTGVLTGVVSGLQKQHLARYVTSIVALIAIPGALFAVQTFEPVRGLLVLGLVNTTLTAVAMAVLVRRLLGEHWRSTHVAAVRPIDTREGLSMSAPVLSSFLDNQLDKALLALAGLQAQVGAFQVVSNLGAQVRNYALYPLNPLLPALSALRGSGRDEDADKMQERLLGLTLTLGSVGSGVLMARPESFTKLWLGADSEVVSLVSSALPLAMLGLWLNMQTSGPYLDALTSGRVHQLARVGYGSALINAIVSAALVVPMGLQGVLIGTVLANGYNLAFYRPWAARGLQVQAGILVLALLITLALGSYTSIAHIVLLVTGLLVAGLVVSVLALRSLREWLWVLSRLRPS